MEAEMEKAEEIKELLVDALHKQAEIQNIFIMNHFNIYTNSPLLLTNIA